MSEMRIRQRSKYEGDEWWSWSVELDAPRDVLARVKCVIYELHPTFPKPVRKITDRESRFRLETAGWGVFPIEARVIFKDGTEEKLKHELKLFYDDGRPNTA